MSCKAVTFKSSIADTYDKPNIMLKEYELDEGDLKFKDYFHSQKRPFNSITNLDNYDEEKLYTEGNKVNLEKLKDAFPFK